MKYLAKQDTAMIELTLDRIIEVINKGWPGIYEASYVRDDPSSVRIEYAKHGRPKIHVKLLGDVAPTMVITDKIKCPNATRGLLQNFLQERAQCIKDNRTHLYKDSECAFGQLVTEWSMTEDSLPFALNRVTGIVTSTAILNLRDPAFEDEDDVIKTMLAGFHLVEHPNDYDSYLSLMQAGSKSNWEQ